MTGLDATHDPARRSFVAGANAPGADFPIQHLPYGVFSSGDRRAHVGVAIGAHILDLTVLEKAGLIAPKPGGRVFDRGTLNPFMALPQQAWDDIRRALADLLDAGNPRLRDDAELADHTLVAQQAAEMHLPIEVRSFTDFYASKQHATNVGTMFRGADEALPPNWLHMPIGYNGRASTVVVSGTPVTRPLGQIKDRHVTGPRLGPSERLDIELELGAVVGTPSTMGRPVTTAEAYDMIFGYVLLNDWSARDLQVWEYQPLGPFQAKAFATTISPWIVTRAALAPFRVAPPDRDPPLLPYLHEATPNNFDIALEVALAPEGCPATTIARSNARHLYYSAAQQLTHHALSGCAMCTGDLLGSGTISGPDAGSAGSLLELTWNGRDPLDIAGQLRRFIEDGDMLTLSGHCDGAYRIGFGSCAGRILPAPPVPGG